MVTDKSGKCELCDNREYSDIYQHRLSKKHKQKVSGEVEPPKEKHPHPPDRTGVCEICGNRKYVNIYRHRIGVKHNKLAAAIQPKQE